MKENLLLLTLLLCTGKSMAQNQLYMGPIKYTSTGFTVYRQICYQPNGIQFFLNETQLINGVDYNQGYCQNGICQTHFAFGLLKPGDKLEVRDQCGSLPMSRIVEDDFVYVEVPNGVGYTGNSIGPNDQSPPYGRLSNRVSVSKCQAVAVGSHALHGIHLIIGNNNNSTYTTGVWKLNGIPLSASSFSVEDLGNSTNYSINTNGSITYDNGLAISSIGQFSGESPTAFEYVHNGVLPFNVQEIKFGPLGVRMWDNGHITIKEYLYDGTILEEERYLDITNSTFKLDFSNGGFRLFLDDVLLKQIDRSVIYRVSNGSISNGSLLPYKTQVDWTPSASGEQWVQAIIDGVRVVRQYFLVAEDIVINESTVNISCNGENNGSITISTTGGKAPFQYSKDGGTTFQSNSSFSDLPAGAYTVLVRDATGCVAQKSVSVSENSPLALSSSSISNETCSGANNGSVSLTATGGTGFYEYKREGQAYSSNPLITGLSAGEHSFWVRDASGCERSLSLRVGLRSSLDATVSITPAKCFAEASGTIAVSYTGNPFGSVQYSLDGLNYQSGSSFNFLPSGTYTVYAKDNLCTVSKINQVVNQPTALQPNVTVNAPVSCNGEGDGSISSAPYGGTSPYFFSLDGTFGINAETAHTFGNLPAGNYKVWIKDSQGCQKDSIVSISEPGIITASVTDKSDATCYGMANGSASVQVIGGNGGNTYKIGTTTYSTSPITGLAAGLYTVKVLDSKNCQTETQVEIFQPDEMEVRPSITKNVNCFAGADGEITVAANGGTGTLSYSIDGINYQASTVFSGLNAGFYTIYVKDAHNCTVDSTHNQVNQPENLIAGTQSVSHVKCFGENDGQVVLKATGGVKDYLFSNNDQYYVRDSLFGGLTQGQYTFWVKDAHGCKKPLDLTIEEPTILVADLEATQDVLCYAGHSGKIMAKASGGSSPYAYSLNGVDYVGGGASHIIDSLKIGTYKVWVKDMQGCSMETNQVTLSQPTEIVPTITDQKNVSCNAGSDASVSLAASGGTGTHSFWLEGSQSPNPPSFFGLSAGTYTFTVKDENLCPKEITAHISEPASPYRVSLVSTTDLSCYQSNTGAIEINNFGGTSPYRTWIESTDTLYSTNATFIGLDATTYTIHGKDAKGCAFALTGISLTEPTDIEISLLEKEDVDCDYYSRGRSKLMATGSNGGFSYTLSGEDLSFRPIVPINNASGEFNMLKAGNYVLTATDQRGCQKEHTVTIISKHSTINFDLNPSLPSTCLAADGAVSITNISGGRAPYQFSISGQSGFGTNPIFTNLLNGNYIVTVADSLCAYKKGVALRLPNSINAAHVLSPIDCGTPDANLTVAPISGGNGNYQLSLNNGPFTNSNTFTNLPPGVYSVQMKDEPLSCQTVLSLEIKEQNRADLTFLERTDILCHGNNTGTIEVKGNNNLSPYQYAINQGGFGSSGRFTNLRAGTYKLYAKNSMGCMDSLRASLTQPSPLRNTTTKNDNLCHSDSTGTITVLGNGGVSPYAFSIDGINYKDSGGFSVLTAGSYTTYVKDAHECMTPQTIDLVEPSQVRVTPQYVDTVRCRGESSGKVQVMAMGGTAAYQYSMDNVNYFPGNEFGNLPAGHYDFFVKDMHQCVGHGEIQLTQPDSLVLHLISQTDPLCYLGKDGSIRVKATGGNGGNEYFTNNINPQGSDLIKNLPQGLYTVKVNDRRGCSFAIKGIQLNHPAQLKHSFSTLEPLCNKGTNGKISIKVSGGTPQYKMQLDGNAHEPNNGADTFVFDQLPSRNFLFATQDANACLDTFTVKLKEPSPLRGRVNVVKNLCYGDSTGTLHIEAQGATLPYQYAILNSYITDDSAYSSKTYYDKLLAKDYVVRFKDGHSCTYDTLVTVGQPEKIRFTAQVTDSVTCYGESSGKLFVKVSGGTPEYLYSHDKLNFQRADTLKNLKKGAYKVYVKDKNACLASHKDSIYVHEPDKLNLSVVSRTNPLCAGEQNGSIQLAAVGGNAKLKYTMDNRLTQARGLFTNLSQGAYTFKVKDWKGCEDTLTSVSLKWPKGLAANVKVQTPSCVEDTDGRLDISVRGGVGGYRMVLYMPSGDSTYQKSGDFTFEGLAPGTYRLQVNDTNGCTLSVPVKVKVAESLHAGIILAPALRDGPTVEVCAGQIVELDAQNPGKRIKWFYNNVELANFENEPRIEVKEEGTYSVSVSNASGCIVADTFELKHNQFALDADFLMATQAFVGDTVVCLDITKPVPNYILWSVHSNMRILETDQDRMAYIPTNEGLLNVTMYAVSGECQNVVQKEIEIFKQSDIDSTGKEYGFDSEPIQKLELFPNPNYGQFRIKIYFRSVTDFEAKLIRSATGEIIYSESVTVDQSQLSNNILYKDFKVKALPGIYTLVIYSRDQRLYVTVAILGY